MGESKEKEMRLKDRVSEVESRLCEGQHCLASVEQERDEVTAKLKVHVYSESNPEDY